MLEIVRYEAEKRIKGTLALAIGLGVLAVFFVAFFPSLEASGIDFGAYVEAYPPAVQEAFGISSLDTIEGFLAVEVYQFLWLLLLGLYFAYSAGGLIAGDVERDRMDLILSLPISRSRVLAEKFASVLVPILALNAVVPVVVYAGVRAIGQLIDWRISRWSTSSRSRICSSVGQSGSSSRRWSIGPTSPNASPSPRCSSST